MNGGELPYLNALPLLRHVVEVGEELVELLLRERIVLVVVAAGAAERQAEPHGRGRLHAVDDVLDGVLLGDDAAFGVAAVVAVEAGGDPLVERGVRAAGRRRVCSMVNWSNGMLRLNASITQSRQRHMKRSPSVW